MPRKGKRRPRCKFLHQSWMQACRLAQEKRLADDPGLPRGRRRRIARWSAAAQLLNELPYSDWTIILRFKLHPSAVGMIAARVRHLPDPERLRAASQAIEVIGTGLTVQQALARLDRGRPGRPAKNRSAAQQTQNPASDCNGSFCQQLALIDDQQKRIGPQLMAVAQRDWSDSAPDDPEADDPPLEALIALLRPR